MKFEPWVPSFMRKIAQIWRDDASQTERPGYEVVDPRDLTRHAVYVYGIETSAGIVEVRSHVMLAHRIGRSLLRVEAE